jgi:CDP-paratose 2-epimerase
VRDALRDVTHVFHFAAQVAVTTSLIDPTDDFDVNARGTLVVLEAVRAMSRPPSLIFTSTNKVYGACEDVPFARDGRRYVPEDRGLRESGIGESRGLEFHSPYGCAKGAADQYVLDWARTYGLRTCVFRMSCIYGPRQFGTEDQGWVAHFLIRALRGEPITIYGDGSQVRDVLYVEDLVDALLVARAGMSRIAGQAFNIGGGPARTTSLLELVEKMEAVLRRKIKVRFAPWRTADQRWYVSDLRKVERLLGWRPRVSTDEGLECLLRWVGSLSPVPPLGSFTAPEQAP